MLNKHNFFIIHKSQPYYCFVYVEQVSKRNPKPSSTTFRSISARISSLSDHPYLSTVSVRVSSDREYVLVNYRWGVCKDPGSGLDVPYSEG